MRLDASGNKRWDRGYGGTAGDGLSLVQPTADGGFVLAGGSLSGVGNDKSEASRGFQDFWLLKVDGQGNKLWDRTLGGSQLDAASDLCQTTDGSYAVVGWSNSGAADGDKTEASRGNTDYWLLKLGAAIPTAAMPVRVRQTLQLYPNPAHAQCTLRLPADAPSTGLRLSLLDATGRLVLTRPLSANGTEVQVPLGAQPAGLYLLRLQGPQGFLATQRLQLQ